ncbi:hypothetical protein Tco_0434792 [Tanacetum coccineum]
MIIRRAREVPDIVLIITLSHELGFRRFNSSRVQNAKIYNHAKDVVVTVSHVIGDAVTKVEMHRNIAWDKVENLNPQSTPQVPPSFEETTPHVTHPEEVNETIGIPTEVEPLDYTKLEDIGLNTNTRDLFLSSKGFPSFDESEPQLYPNFHP